MFKSAISLLLLASVPASADDVVLASRRAGAIEVLDPISLATIGRIDTAAMTEGVTSSPDGRTLYVRRAMRTQPRGCCALFAIDLERQDSCYLIEPTTGVAVTANGDRLFTQRGNMGVEVFDGKTFAKLPTMRAPNIYQLLPSPDGKWVFGVSGGESSVDMFDLDRNALVRNIAVRDGYARGAWMDDRFYLFTRGKLWTLTPQSETPGTPVPVVLPGAAACEPAIYQLMSSGGLLYLYESFGTTLDRRASCGQPVTGGLYAIDPVTGWVISHVAEARYFSHVAVNQGRAYGIDIATRNPQLVSIDLKTGDVLAARVLDSDVWNLALAGIPGALVPHGEMRPAECRK